MCSAIATLAMVATLRANCRQSMFDGYLRLGALVDSTHKYMRPSLCRLTPTCVTQTIIRSRFHRDSVDRNACCFTDIHPHFLYVGPKPYSAQHHESIDIGYLVTASREQPCEVANEVDALRILSLRIILGKVCPKVSISYRSRKGIHKCMSQYITITMGSKALLGRNGHSTQDKGAPQQQSMNVLTSTDAQ